MDPNPRDQLSMLPAEMAIQAGNLEEIAAIIAHRKFRLQSLGHAELYVMIGMRAAIDPYPEAEMRQAIAAVAATLRAGRQQDIAN